MAMFDGRDAEEASRQLIHDCGLLTWIDNFGKNLSSNEKAFLASFKKWINRGLCLSAKQRAVAMEIGAKRCEKAHEAD